MKTTFEASQEQLIGRIQSYLFVEISQLNAFIDEYTSSNQGLIREIAGYIFSSGGKRIRPVLTILCSKLFNYNKDLVHIYLATAVEFIHTATLLHDDVVDGSTVRRGNETANIKWGSKASILVGDYLFSQAFKLMTYARDQSTQSVLSSAAVKIAEGEVSQLVASSSLNISFDKYIEIVSGKTAELFAAACCVAGTIAEQDHKICDNLWKFGLNLGILFQIIDDQLDYFANEEEFDKNLGDDFIEGKVTLPVLLSYSLGSNQNFWDIMFAKNLRTKDDFKQAIEVMESEGINTKIADFIANYYDLANDALLSLPESEAKSILKDILNFTIYRGY